MWWPVCEFWVHRLQLSSCLSHLLAVCPWTNYITALVFPTCKNGDNHTYLGALLWGLNEKVSANTHFAFYLFIYPLMHLFILINSYTHSFIHIHSLIHTYSFIHTLIHSFICTFIHSFVHSFIHSYTVSLSFSWLLCRACRILLPRPGIKPEPP